MSSIERDVTVIVSLNLLVTHKNQTINGRLSLQRMIGQNDLLPMIVETVEAWTGVIFHSYVEYASNSSSSANEYHWCATHQTQQHQGIPQMLRMRLIHHLVAIEYHRYATRQTQQHQGIHAEHVLNSSFTQCNVSSQLDEVLPRKTLLTQNLFLQSLCLQKMIMKVVNQELNNFFGINTLGEQRISLKCYLVLYLITITCHCF